MGFSYYKIKDDYFITINGKPFTDYNPQVVAAFIAALPKEEKELIEATIKNKLMDKYEEMTGIPLPDDYAKHAGRPSLKKVPYMKSENDGYPFLKGHLPTCTGKKYYRGRCKCKYDAYNKSIGHRPMWPGGPDMDDFDV